MHEKAEESESLSNPETSALSASDLPRKLPDRRLFAHCSTSSDSGASSVPGEVHRFSGLFAVIRHRLDQRSLDQLKLAAELFKWTIEFGLFLCDTTGHATIKVGSGADVAPCLLGRILSPLPDDSGQKNPARQVPPSDFEQRFLPLAPVLTMLNETIESAGCPPAMPSRAGLMNRCPIVFSGAWKSTSGMLANSRRNQSVGSAWRSNLRFVLEVASRS